VTDMLEHFYKAKLIFKETNKCSKGPERLFILTR